MRFKKYITEATVLNNIKRTDDIRSMLEKVAKKLGKGEYKFEAKGFRSINNPKDYTFKGKFKVLDDDGAYLIKRGKNSYRVDGFKINPSAMRKNTSSIVDIETIKIG